MKALNLALSAIGVMALLSTNAHASVVVPEIDGTMATIALGLTAGMVALIRERRKNK